MSSEPIMDPHVLLVGDSIMVRLRQMIMPVSDYSRRRQLAVSGAKIGTMMNILRRQIPQMELTAVILVGCNNLIQSTGKNKELRTMVVNLKRLNRIANFKFGRVVWLTILPSPRIVGDPVLEKWRRVCNQTIMTFGQVADLDPHFFGNSHLFERYYSGNRRRPDLLHPSPLGLKVLEAIVNTTLAP